MYAMLNAYYWFTFIISGYHDEQIVWREGKHHWPHYVCTFRVVTFSRTISSNFWNEYFVFNLSPCLIHSSSSLQTPGPGTYGTIIPHLYKKKSPAYTLSGHCAMPGDSTQKPGPGAHSPERVNNKIINLCTFLILFPFQILILAPPIAIYVMCLSIRQ
jgi:hypothetical protein